MAPAMTTSMATAAKFPPRAILASYPGQKRKADKKLQYIGEQPALLLQLDQT